jgi:hypothetical protein
MHNVFVFGMLKRGQPNFYLMKNPRNGKAVFIAEGKTEEKFPVVIVSRCNIPFMLPVSGVGKVCQLSLCLYIALLINILCSCLHLQVYLAYSCAFNNPKYNYKLTATVNNNCHYITEKRQQKRN